MRYRALKLPCSTISGSMESDERGGSHGIAAAGRPALLRAVLGVARGDVAVPGRPGRPRPDVPPVPRHAGALGAGPPPGEGTRRRAEPRFGHAFAAAQAAADRGPGGPEPPGRRRALGPRQSERRRESPAREGRRHPRRDRHGDEPRRRRGGPAARRAGPPDRVGERLSGGSWHRHDQPRRRAQGRRKQSRPAVGGADLRLLHRREHELRDRPRVRREGPRAAAADGRLLPDEPPVPRPRGPRSASAGGSGSSSTSAPACRPRATCTRSPTKQRASSTRACSTSTTSPSRSRTRRCCSPTPPTRTPPRHRRGLPAARGPLGPRHRIRRHRRARADRAGDQRGHALRQGRAEPGRAAGVLPRPAAVRLAAGAVADDQREPGQRRRAAGADRPARVLRDHDEPGFPAPDGRVRTLLRRLADARAGPRLRAGVAPGRATPCSPPRRRSPGSSAASRASPDPPGFHPGVDVPARSLGHRGDTRPPRKGNP